jgi:hypothetical protein
MLNRIKNGGIFALVLAAGMAMMQPASAQAADRHDGGNRDRGRVVQNWDRGRDVRVREYVRQDYAPVRRYYDDRHYRSHIAYPTGVYACPR